jgi:hypothetical protein
LQFADYVLFLFAATKQLTYHWYFGKWVCVVLSLPSSTTGGFVGC